MFLGYACNRLGTYFNLLVWIGALESLGTHEWFDVFATFIRVVYGKMVYMSVCRISREYDRALLCLIIVTNFSEMLQRVKEPLCEPNFLCVFVLRITSVSIDSKITLNPTVVYATDRSNAVVLVFNSYLCRLMTKPTKWHVRPTKTQISLGIRPVWSESSLSAWRNLGHLTTYWAHSEDSDQTGRMPRLIWVCARRTVILLVLSRGGSYFVLICVCFFTARRYTLSLTLLFVVMFFQSCSALWTTCLGTLCFSCIVYYFLYFVLRLCVRGWLRLVSMAFSGLFIYFHHGWHICCPLWLRAGWSDLRLNDGTGLNISLKLVGA